MPPFKLKPPHFLAAFFLLIVYFFTRLYQLTLIPVFVDEAIYVRWSQVMRNEPTLRFLPLSDGKQPLFMWLLMPVFKLFSDPLFAGRFVSVMAGLGTLTGLLLLTYYLTKSLKTSFVAGLLYIFIPFTFFFDRMALVDSLLSMFGIWSLFIGLLLVKNPRFDLAFVLGYILGGAVLTKSPGWVFLFLQPLLVLTLSGLKRPHFLKLLVCWTISGLNAFLFYNLLRLGPGFELLSSRTADYSYPLREVLQHPFNPFRVHIVETYLWLTSLLTLPIFSLLILSPFFAKNRRLIFTLLLWSVLPLLAQASIAKAYTSRYFLYTVPPLLLVASLTLTQITSRLKPLLGYAIITLVFLLPLYINYQLFTDPPHASIPDNMKEGYFQEWTAGYGQVQVANYLKDVAKTSSVVAGTDGYFGTLPDGLQIYTQDVPHLTVIGVGLPIKAIPESLENSLKENQVFLVINQSRNQLPPSQLERLKLIATYPKPFRANGTREQLQFYQLLR